MREPEYSSTECGHCAEPIRYGAQVVVDDVYDERAGVYVERLVHADCAPVPSLQGVW